MTEENKKQRVQLFQRICRDQGIPFTLQRRTILETVLDLDDHPTTDQVFTAVSQHTPGISRTTVYRTLETLARMDILTKVFHPGSVVRYDTRLEIHHHLVCRFCDVVIDISESKFEYLSIPDTSHWDFEVHQLQVQLGGICFRCRKKEES